MKTKQEQLYDLLCGDPHISNNEAAELLNISSGCARATKHKLAKKGLIKIV